MILDNRGVVSHQIFMTWIAFSVFIYVFRFLFYQAIFDILQSRLNKNALLKNLCEKNHADKSFYDQESLLLSKMKKEKIDSYIMKSLAKDEKQWNNDLLEAQLENKKLLEYHASVALSCDEIQDIQDFVSRLKEGANL